MAQRGMTIPFGVVMIGSMLALVFTLFFVFGGILGGVDPGAVTPDRVQASMVNLKNDLNSGCSAARSAGSAADTEREFDFSTVERVVVEGRDVIAERAEDDDFEVNPLECEQLTICEETTAESGCSGGGEVPGRKVTLRMSFTNQSGVGPVTEIKVVPE